MNGSTRNANAFTLIEILVVIAIIGALTGILVPNFMAARERARDAQRKSDLKQIQKALELYKLDQSSPSYIANGASNSFPNSGSQWTGSGSVVYMKKVPSDPKTTSVVSYYYSRPTTTTYVLSACLENKADPEGVTCPASITTNFSWCSQASPAYKCYTLTEP